MPLLVLNEPAKPGTAHDVIEALKGFTDAQLITTDDVVVITQGTFQRGFLLSEEDMTRLRALMQAPGTGFTFTGTCTKEGIYRPETIVPDIDPKMVDL